MVEKCLIVVIHLAFYDELDSLTLRNIRLVVGYHDNLLIPLWVNHDGIPRATRL